MIHFTKRGLHFEIPSRTPAEDAVILQRSLLTVLQIPFIDTDKPSPDLSHNQRSAIVDTLELIKHMAPDEKQLRNLHDLERRSKDGD